MMLTPIGAVYALQSGKVSRLIGLQLLRAAAPFRKEKDNFLEHIEGRPMTHSFDGHANCFVESGDGKGLLIDFNYEVEPLPGKYPVPGIGPFSLLEESRVNHWGKVGFRWAYWNVLLPGRPMPMSPALSMAGKRLDAQQLETAH